MTRRKAAAPVARAVVAKGPKPIQLSVEVDCADDKTVADLLLELDGIPQRAIVQPYSYSSRFDFESPIRRTLTFSWEQER